MERANPRRVTVKCAAVRWVDDEPQPGWIEYQLTDAEGVTWSFFVRIELDAQDDALIVVSTLCPNGLESTDGKSEFRVRQSQIDS